MGQKVSAVARRRGPQGSWRTNQVASGRGEYGKSLSYGEKRRTQRKEVARREGYVVNWRGLTVTEGRAVVKRERVDARYGRRRPATERAQKGTKARKGRRRAGRQRVARRYGTQWKEVERKVVDRTRRRRTPEAQRRREERRAVKTKYAWPKTVTGAARAGAVVLRHEWTLRETRGERRRRALSEGRKHKEVRGYRDARRKKAWERKPQTHRRRGYHLVVKGTLNGGRRTRTQVRNQGKVPRSERDANRGVSRLHAKTKVGTMGVRRTCCYRSVRDGAAG